MHAALGTFTALEEPTGNVMKRGIPFSSAARFPARADLGSASLLLQSQGGHDSDLVRVELLANPRETANLSGVEFELLGREEPFGSRESPQGCRRVYTQGTHRVLRDSSARQDR